MVTWLFLDDTIIWMRSTQEKEFCVRKSNADDDVISAIHYSLKEFSYLWHVLCKVDYILSEGICFISMYQS